MEITLEDPGRFARIQRQMIGHGMLILLIGLLAGAGLLISLIGGLEVWVGKIVPIQIPGSSDAWVRLHLGEMLNAFFIILIALVLPVIRFDARRARRISWMVVGTGWANTIFYIAALFAPNRALTFGDNRFGEGNIASVIGALPPGIFAIVAVIAVSSLIHQAFIGIEQQTSLGLVRR